MKKIIVLALILLLNTSAYAALTVGNVPKTKTGGTTPSLENSGITDLSGNIGVNSTAPGQKLDVTGSVRATAFIGDGASVTSVGASHISGVVPIANLATGTPTGSKFIRDDGTLQVPPSSGSSQWTTTGNDIYYATGNTGVGSTAPSDLLQVRETNSFTKVYNYDGVSTYSDNTTEAKKTYGSPFNFLASNTQTLYLGSSSKFNGMSFSLKQLTTAASALIITYWNGSTWAALTSTDNTNNFRNDGTIAFTAPSNWAQTSVNSQTLYWVSIQSTSTFTTTPTMYSVRPGTNSVLSTYSSVSDTTPSFIISQNGNLLTPNIAGTQTSVATPVTLVVGLTTSRGGRRVDFLCSGSKDQTCINSAIAACGSSPCKIVLLEGTYNITGPIGYNTGLGSTTPLINNLDIGGQGSGLTKIVSSNNTGATFQDIVNFSTLSPLTNFSLHDMEIDRSADTKDASISRKALFVRYMKNVRIYNIYAHDSGATCIGIDFLNGAFINNNFLVNCGTTTATTGSSGIGIGTSEYTTEPDVITNNIVTGSGYAGVLIENQAGSTAGLSNNFIVSNNILTGGAQYGLVIDKASNINASGNIIRSNTKDGVIIKNGSSVSPNNIILSNNHINDNTLFGINISSTTATYVQIKNNDLSGNGSGTVSRSNTATQDTLFGNLGDTQNYMLGNIGLGSTAPGALLDLSGGRMRTVGIGTTVPQAACIKADGTFGYYTSTTFAGVCN